MPWAPPVEMYRPPSPEDLAEIVSRYELPRSFLLYPAQTWPHKNHRRLVEAVKEAEERGCTDVNVVCTGHGSAGSTVIVAEARRLGIADRIRFLG